MNLRTRMLEASKRSRREFRMRRFRRVGPICAAAALSLFDGAALAQSADHHHSPEAVVETVVVTARRVKENIQQVPLTVTALDAGQLKQQNIETASQLMYAVPSLTVNPYFGIQFSSYSVRGLSSLNNGTSVATYFEGSPCCVPNPSIPFTDLESIEVLNGPQGTLFGRTSASGAILFRPVHPDLDEFGGIVHFTVGDYGRAQANAAVNLPLIDDRLAARISVSDNFVGGYTKAIGTGMRYDDQRSQTVRLGLEFKDRGFDDYVAFDYVNLHQTPTNAVLVGVDTVHGAGGLYNLPSSDAPAVFGAICQQAFVDGLVNDVNDCINSRYDTLVGIKTALDAELARVSAGGDAIRSEQAPAGGNPAFVAFRDFSVVNDAEYRLLAGESLTLTLNDIFSFESGTNNSGYPTDGIGGLAEESGAQQTASYGSSNELGTKIIERLGPYPQTFNNDLQARFEGGDPHLTGVVGFFYTHNSQPGTDLGVGSLYRVFGGVFNENLGFSAGAGFPAGGHGSEAAVYTQETLDLAAWIHGLKATGGFRYSWDDTYNSFHAAVEDNVTGVFSPDAALAVSKASSQGANYTASLTEQATDELMAYLTVSRAYVPGGVNGQFGNLNLPNYTPTYAPESLLTEELGVKWDLQLAGAPARINADVYNYDFGDIQEFFSGISNGVGLNYIENIAAARLRGFETEATFLPDPAWQIRMSYNYNDFHYTKWTGEDPLTIAQPGDPLCVPSSPPGYCYLDLTKNPAAGMPHHQGHVTVVYRLPVNSAFGYVDLAATLYGQSRVYFPATAYRQMQVSGPGALESVSQDPYALLDFRATWSNVMGGSWAATAFVSNVADQTYKLGTTSQLWSLGEATATYAPPRMFGVELSKKF